MCDTPSHYALSFCELLSNLLQKFTSNTILGNLTFDMIVTLTLGIGTHHLCATHLLIMFYLSVKFR